MKTTSLLALVVLVALASGCAPESGEDPSAGAGAISGGAEGSGSKAAAESSATSSSATVAGLPNLRDLGGKATPGGRVKTGRLFRSEQLGGMTDTGAWNALHVAEIVDFRGSPEVALAPDPSLPPSVPLPLPIFDEAHAADDLGAQLAAKVGALGDAQTPEAAEAARADLDAWSATLHDRMVSSYEDFVTASLATDQFKTFVDRVGDGKVTSFHCVSSKDRTGFAAAIVLRGVGVSWQDTLADYLESNARLEADNVKKIAALGQTWTDEPGHAGASGLRVILGVDKDYLTASFAKIQELYGDGHPATGDEVASDAAIASYFAQVYGDGVQQRLKTALLE